MAQIIGLEVKKPVQTEAPKKEAPKAQEKPVTKPTNVTQGKK